MTHRKSLLRPGSTAIAAVLALSATPLLAQTIDQPAEAAAVESAAPAAAASPAAAPISVTPPATPTATAATAREMVPNAAGLNIPKISVDLDAPATAQTTAAPAPRAEPAAVAAPARTTAPTRTAAPLAMDSEAPTIAARPAAATPAAPSDIASPAPAAAAPTAAAIPVATVAPADARPAQVQGDTDLLPVAGAGALALALVGGGFALSRRKRHAQDGEDALVADPVSADAMTAAPPARDPVRAEAYRDAPATAPVVAPVTAAASGAASALPAGFDLSRYGRHVQAAYRGPTPDNPSHSLRKRLARARFFDQRERMAATPAMAQAATRTAATADRVQPAAATRRPSETTATRSGGWTRPTLRPSFQS